MDGVGLALRLDRRQHHTGPVHLGKKIFLIEGAQERVVVRQGGRARLRRDLTRRQAKVVVAQIFERQHRLANKEGASGTRTHQKPEK
jgi:hypothetical protein